MKCTLFVLLWFCCSINQVWAQTTDVDSLVLARQLITMHTFPASAKENIKEMALKSATLVQRDNPGKNQLVDQIVNEAITPVMSSALDDYYAKAAARYAKDLTAAELQEIVKFESSPLGQRYISVNHEISDQLHADFKIVWDKKTEEAMRELSVDLQKHNLSVPKELNVQKP